MAGISCFIDSNTPRMLMSQTQVGSRGSGYLRRADIRFNRWLACDTDIDQQRADPLRSNAVPAPAVGLTLGVETSKQHNRLLFHLRFLPTVFLTSAYVVNASQPVEVMTRPLC
jgi:hypothetical protein